jgi:nitrogen fixation protein FixH
MRAMATERTESDPMTDTTETDYRPGGRPFTGRRFLYVILGFFGVIFAANFTMAYFALNNFRGVVVDSGYVASQHFNADSAELDAQAARGWAIEANAPGGAPLVAIRDADGAPLQGLSVAGTAMRPTDERLDRALALVETAPGLYAAAEALSPGQWKLALKAEGAGPRYSTVIDLFVEPR